MLLLENGFKNILVEKPAGLDFQEIAKVAEESKRYYANVFVAYNRRFYGSVQKAQQIIAEDGGVISFNFEFTEWSHEIEPLKKATGIKQNWFLANSTHVVDLAFYLGGRPIDISSYIAGGLSWHPLASIFSGSGVTEKGALFSYSANWESAGRWSVEVLTRVHKLILCPIEKLKIQKRGSLEVKHVDTIDYSFDERFKPGIYIQCNNFISQNYGDLIHIEEHYRNSKVYHKIIDGQH